MGIPLSDDLFDCRYRPDIWRFCQEVINTFNAYRIKSDAEFDNLDNRVTALENEPVGAVSGVKGNAESSYRTGNVNITLDNIADGDDIVNAIDTIPVSNSVDAEWAMRARQDEYGRNIGSTYATNTALNNKQDALTAGFGISIVNNVIAVSLPNANGSDF